MIWPGRCGGGGWTSDDLYARMQDARDAKVGTAQYGGQQSWPSSKKLRLE
jgi:hypothetical protein